MTYTFFHYRMDIIHYLLFHRNYVGMIVIFLFYHTPEHKNDILLTISVIPLGG